MNIGARGHHQPLAGQQQADSLGGEPVASSSSGMRRAQLSKAEQMASGVLIRRPLVRAQGQGAIGAGADRGSVLCVLGIELSDVRVGIRC